MPYPVPALPQGKRYLTVHQVAQQYPAFSESSLRWLRFNGHENGLNACTIKIGRRLLIDADLFEKWVDGCRVSGA